ncbi:hypothetical protein ABE424_18040 [Stenotrophomonas sp. TWI1149]|uniref:hypothetical protein n=1 Tax=unclassified Stenotrophomonas TaxID=196198 RepID=UPI003208D645
MPESRTHENRIGATKMDVETLEKLWPLMTRYPWAFLTIFVAGVLLGVAAQKAWVAVTTARPKPSMEATPPVPAKEQPVPAAPLFKPSDLQVECIRVLRYFDDTWVSASQISPKLAMVTPPKADLRQALEGLAEKGWAMDRLSTISEPRYRLKGAGLDYAQKRGFPVGPEIDRPRP